MHPASRHRLDDGELARLDQSCRTRVSLPKISDIQEDETEASLGRLINVTMRYTARSTAGWNSCAPQVTLPESVEPAEKIPGLRFPDGFSSK